MTDIIKTAQKLVFSWFVDVNDLGDEHVNDSRGGDDLGDAGVDNAGNDDIEDRDADGPMADMTMKTIQEGSNISTRQVLFST